MKTVEQIEQKASEYVDIVRNRIDSYAYLDVMEAFTEGALWMQGEANKASEDIVDSNIDDVVVMFCHVCQKWTTKKECPICGNDKMNPDYTY